MRLSRSGNLMGRCGGNSEDPVFYMRRNFANEIGDAGKSVSVTKSSQFAAGAPAIGPSRIGCSRETGGCCVALAATGGFASRIP